MIVLDTHVLVWWVSGSRRLSTRAKRAITQSLRQGPVIVSTISALELVTAVRRGRLQFGMPVDHWLSDLRKLPELRFEPVSLEVASLAGSFDETTSGDPADRIILATALTLHARLVTADARLRGSDQVEAVW